MDAAEKKRLFECLARLTHALGAAIGSNCEVVLHDFSDPERSIIAIENGHVTGRKVGDPLDVLGFQLLRQLPAEDLINYRTETKNGKILRSSSIFLREESGEIFGAMCVNLDITGFVNAQRLIETIVTPDTAGIQESFEHDVDEVLGIFIKDAIRTTGKEITAMDREDKIAVVAYLETKGAFLIRHSIDRVAGLLNISKYTIYNYLEEVKSRQEIAEEAKR